MEYLESVAYIESLMPGDLKAGLERMKAFLAFYPHLANTAPCFHVGGTNGKGSTTVMLESALHGGFGLKVGRFSGPHILNWTERISINGKAISEADFARCVLTIKNYSSQFADKTQYDELSWFELLTAMALLHFYENKTDCVVLEVGLGGRFDATNAVSNVISTIITNIELDHMHILGDTLEKIAAEKAGIMKPEVSVITQAKGAGKEVLIEKAEAASSPIFCLDGNIEEGKNLVNDWLSVNGNQSLFCDDILEKLSLTGDHQRENALCALLSLARAKEDEFSLKSRIAPDTGEKLALAFSEIYWPGRLQEISGSPKFKNMNIILDAAHNPNGAEVLSCALSKMNISKRCYILGFFSNKDVPSFLARLLASADAQNANDDVIIAYQADSHRQTMDKNEILRLCSSLRPDLETIAVENMEEALAKASQFEKDGYSVVATGSFAVLKDVMRELGWNSVEHAQIKGHFQTI